MGVKDLWLRLKGIFIKKLPESSSNSEIEVSEKSNKKADNSKAYREEIANKTKKAEKERFEKLLKSGQEHEFFTEILRLCGIKTAFINNLASVKELISQVKVKANNDKMYNYSEEDGFKLKENLSYDEIIKFINDLKKDWNIGKNDVSYRVPDVTTFGGNYRRYYKFIDNKDGTISEKIKEQFYKTNEYKNIIRKDDTEETLIYNSAGIETKRIFNRESLAEVPYIGYSSKGGQINKYYAEVERNPEDIAIVTYTKGEEKLVLDLSQIEDIYKGYNDIANLGVMKQYFLEDQIDGKVLYKYKDSNSQAYEERKKRIEELFKKSKYSKSCMEYGSEMMRE